MVSDQRGGPLRDVRVIELGGIGSVPFCGMLLADLGADVIRIERASDRSGSAVQNKGGVVINRGKRILRLDLKAQAGCRAAHRLAQTSDILVEGFRPGVAERLGLGPGDLTREHPRLVYGRLTGWGRQGPLADKGGHDINYAAQAGVLAMLGAEGEPPLPPLNLLSDYAGGALFLTVGLIAALADRRRTGLGQVVDADMTHGTALLAAVYSGLRATAEWADRRGANRLDGGAPYYRTYQCSDGKYIAVGAAEDKFFAVLAAKLGLSAETAALCRGHRDGWPEGRARLAIIFGQRSREEWCELLTPADCCVTPVLAPSEAEASQANRLNRIFTSLNGITQPEPSPSFSRTPVPALRAVQDGPDTANAILADAGFSTAEIAALLAEGAVTRPLSEAERTAHS